MVIGWFLGGWILRGLLSSEDGHYAECPWSQRFTPGFGHMGNYPPCICKDIEKRKEVNNEKK